MRRALVRLAVAAVATGMLLVMASETFATPHQTPVVHVYKHPVIEHVVPTTTLPPQVVQAAPPTTVAPAPPPTVTAPVAAPKGAVTPPPPPPVSTVISVRLAVVPEALSLVGTSPVYAADGFWCWEFVNQVEAEAGTAGFTPSTGPNDFLSYPVDTAPQPGDVAVYGDAQQMTEGNNNAIHVGIVESVNGDGTFTAIEGNGASATTVTETVRPMAGPGPLGEQVIEFVTP